MAIKVKITVPIYSDLVNASAKTALDDSLIIEDQDASERFIKLTLGATSYVVLAQDIKSAVENAINNARFA